MRGRFLKYVFQSTMGMIGLSIYILADTFFISKSAGADGITVLNLVLPLYGLIYAIGAMIGIGAATRFTIQRMQGRDSSQYFTQALLWQLILSIPFIVFGLAAPDVYLRMMGGDPGIVAKGIGYTRIVFFGSPFFMTNFTFTAFARNDHATTKVMLATLAGSFFNIIFDYILMFPLGMGMVGAALATAVSPVVTIAVTLTHYLGKKSHIPVMRPVLSLQMLISFCQLGFSSFVGEISSAVTTTVFNFLLLGIAGNTGVAAYGVIANLSIVAISVFNGIAQGVQPLLSKAYGRGRTEEIRKLLRWGITTVLIMEGLIVAAAWIFTDPMTAVFNSESNLLLAEYAHTGMRLYFLGFLFAGINILMVNYFSSIARAGAAFVASLLRGIFAVSASAVILAALYGINGVWLSFLCSELITFVVILVLNRSIKWQIVKSNGIRRS